MKSIYIIVDGNGKPWGASTDVSTAKAEMEILKEAVETSFRIIVMENLAER